MLLGGISFEKGCYTGQEIIARTHFRGAIKRRMFRFRAHWRDAPNPATRIVAGEQHAGDVVEARAPTDGRQRACSRVAECSAQMQASRSRLRRVPSGACAHMYELPTLPYQV